MKKRGKGRAVRGPAGNHGGSIDRPGLGLTTGSGAAKFRPDGLLAGSTKVRTSGLRQYDVGGRTRRRGGTIGEKGCKEEEEEERVVCRAPDTQATPATQPICASHSPLFPVSLTTLGVCTLSIPRSL
uniref:Uncharacterized protein n=1 Tax=Pristionchus pacificus TaxID=54126 RepID=A0A2A6C0C6_PRIPA|eukprot:PDM71569.1 hypothetical protein PRIPAC_37976 [Pristionchus pacificus]